MHRLTEKEIYVPVVNGIGSIGYSSLAHIVEIHVLMSMMLLSGNQLPVLRNFSWWNCHCCFGCMVGQDSGKQKPNNPQKYNSSK